MIDVGLEAALDVLGAPAHVEAVAERHELLRFAGSRPVYQHSEERLRVRVRLGREGRDVWGVAESLDPTGLRALRVRLEDAARAMPRSRRRAAAPAVAAVSTAPVPEPRLAPAEGRLATLRALVERLGARTSVGGSIAHSRTRHAVAATSGLRRDQTRTRAALIAVADADGASSFGRRLGPAGSEHGIEDGIADEIAAGLAPRRRFDLEPGRYRAVLGPQAVVTLLATLGQVGFGGRAYLDGASFVTGRLGERVLSPVLSIAEDAAASPGLPSAFDGEGWPKRRVQLVDGGVATGVVHDAATAAEAGAVPTGHTAPPMWRFGADPIPSHMTMDAGTASDDELLAAIGDGIYIQRVDYVRVQHPRATRVTGTTRDATLLVRRGRVAGRLPQFRFALDIVPLLSDVLAVGARRQVGDTAFMESVVAPALAVGAMPVLALTGS